MDDTERIMRGYRGEPIEIQRVLEKVKELAERNGWRRDLASSAHESVTQGVELLAYHRLSKPSLHRVYLSTGIHGDEPAGPIAALQLLKENTWPHGVDIFLCPCLNLTGFPLNRRENAKGIDLNRDYRDAQSDEIRSHIEWLKRKPSFDGLNGFINTTKCFQQQSSDVVALRQVFARQTALGLDRGKEIGSGRFVAVHVCNDRHA